MGYLHSWSQDHHYQCHRRQNGGSRWKKASSFYCVLWTCVIIQQCWPLAALRPLRDKDVTSWGDQILPEKYSYFRRVDRDGNHVVDCVICMAGVDTVQRSSECMVTPCEHFFHAGCLQRWMDIKMECPTCRRPLPPV